MAQVHPPSLLNQFLNFTDATAGLEKTLRLIQAVITVVAELHGNNVTVAKCLIAKSQLALARRYFRLLDFIGAFQRVLGILGGDSSSRGMVLMLIDLASFSCLGMYFLLENLTILHDMNVWPVPWNTPVLTEANKFWFYAISLSILGAVWELLFGTAQETKAQPNGSAKKSGPEKENPQKQVASSTLLKGIVINSCDLVLPGIFLGWIPVDDLQVGSAMIVSTLLAAQGIWAKAQQ